MHQQRNKLSMLSTIILLLANGFSYALPSDGQQSATIIADSAEINRNTGIGIYRGHVQIKQGSMVVTADQVTSYSNKQNKIIKAVAIGKPTQYQTQPQPNQAIIVAIADKIEYYPIRKLVVLTGNAHVTQGSNNIASPQIVYDMAHDVTHTAQAKNQKTMITFTPDQTKSKT